MDPILLPDSDFRRLFPFHLRVNAEGRLTSIGHTLEKVTGLKIGILLEEGVEIERPFLTHFSFKNILELPNTLFLLRTLTEPRLRLRGEWLLPQGQSDLLFVGSAWISDTVELKELDLSMSDFSVHDPMVDVLHLIKTNEIAMNDLKEVLAQFQKQQIDLKWFSQIVTESINGVVITNQSGEIEWINRSFEKMTGYSLGESKGKKPGDFLQGPETDKNTVLYLRRQISLGQSFSCEILNYTKGGTPYWVRIAGQPLLNHEGKVEKYFAIEEDITEQKDAVLRLSWSEEKYRGIIDNMNLGLVEFDRDDHVVFCNHSYSRMTGYSLEELQGKPVTDLLKKRNFNFEPAFAHQRRHKGITDVYEVEITTKGGEAKWILVSKALMYDSQRRITGSIGILLDITGRKNLELELTRSQEIAQQSSKAKESFLVNMSHEIRTPMNVIMGMSRQLGQSLTDPRQQRIIQSIVTASDNMLVIINDVLDISKIEAGKLEIEKTGFRIRKSVEEIRQFLAFKAEEKGLRLSCDIDEDVPQILLGDPFRLNQILMNIGGNAIKFTEEGTVDINVYVERTLKHQVILRIVVEDTGIGIDSDKLEEVFESFRQESPSISRQYGGSGLGLTISRELARLMGGELRLDSLRGVGTRVVLELPFESGTESDIESPENIASDSTLLHDRKVLVVEDNIMNQVLAQSVLENYGATVSVAGSGREALDQLALSRFDIILMDIRLPGMDGLEVTRRIRRDIRLDTPVIALTANTSSQVKEAIKEAGMNDYLLKPYPEGLLIRKIKGVLKLSSPALTSTLISAPAVASKLYDTVKLEAFTVRNPDFLKRMLQLFIEETSAGFRDLKAAATRGDFTTVGDLAHRMKPSIDQLMISDLYEGVKKIEMMAKNGDPEGLLQGNITEMEGLLVRVVDQIKANEL